jgi:hypothetical protein
MERLIAKLKAYNFDKGSFEHLMFSRILHLRENFFNKLDEQPSTIVTNSYRYLMGNPDNSELYEQYERENYNLISGFYNSVRSNYYINMACIAGMSMTLLTFFYFIFSKMA